MTLTTSVLVGQDGGLKWLVGGGVVVVILVVASAVGRLRDRRARSAARALADAVARTFLVQPCSRCHEDLMMVLEVSPNGRSVHYQCQHCRKKLRAAAASPEASEVVVLFDAHQEQAHHGYIPVFRTQLAPLPYEQTTREPIPEAVRSEVWRRDQGRCVKCGSNQRLQFDHIIPVSKGGATVTTNLQLLCMGCNQSKGASI